MITILDLGPEVVGYRVDGDVTREDIDRVFSEVETKLAGGKRLRVLADVVSFSGITLSALWQDLRRGLESWRALGKIDKAALVSDIEWIRRAALWEDKVLSGIQIRIFPTEERARAEAWILE